MYEYAEKAQLTLILEWDGKRKSDGERWLIIGA